jgi:hypothetical protein
MWACLSRDNKRAREIERAKKLEYSRDIEQWWEHRDRLSEWAMARNKIKREREKIKQQQDNSVTLENLKKKYPCVLGPRPMASLHSLLGNNPRAKLDNIKNRDMNTSITNMLDEYNRRDEWNRVSGDFNKGQQRANEEGLLDRVGRGRHKGKSRKGKSRKGKSRKGKSRRRNKSCRNNLR